MIKFTIFSDNESHSSKYYRFIQRINESESLHLSEDVDFTPGPPVLPGNVKNGPITLKNGDESENAGVPLTYGGYIKTDNSDNANVVDDLSDYSGGDHQCLFYPKSKYAICGWSDSDPFIPLVATLPIFDIRQDAEDTLINGFGYGKVLGIVHSLLGRTGEYAKAYYSDPRYRWQGEIYQDPATSKYYIWTDGPEPDPVYALFFGGGIEAVQDWHDIY